jgi:hypothetical protein
LNGYRPSSHLRRLTAPVGLGAVLSELRRPIASTGRALVTEAGAARPAGRPALRPTDRIRLRHLRVSETSPGVIEAVAVLGRGNRRWALAYRLDRSCDGWLCTLLQVV